MSQPTPAASRRSSQISEESAGPAHYGRMLLIMSVLVGAGLAVRALLNPTDLAMLVLLGVVLVATTQGRGPAVAASILGLASYDFLFVPPYYSFDATDKSYFITFAVMLIVALSLTRLTGTIREQALDAEERADRNEALLELVRDLADAPDRNAVLAAAERHIGRAGNGRAAVIVADSLGVDQGIPNWPTDDLFGDIAVRVAAGWAWQHNEPAGSGTAHGAEAEGLVVPLRTSSRTLGVVVLQPAPPDRRVTAAERATVQVLADQTALALELTSRTLAGATAG